MILHGLKAQYLSDLKPQTSLKAALGHVELQIAEVCGAAQLRVDAWPSTLHFLPQASNQRPRHRISGSSPSGAALRRWTNGFGAFTALTNGKGR